MSVAIARPSSWQWSGALMAALLLHGSLAMAFHHLIQGGAAGAGRAGIEIGLGPAGGAPGEAVGEAGPPQSAEVKSAVVDEAPAVVPEAAAVPPVAPPEAPRPPSEAAQAVAPQQNVAALPETAAPPSAAPEAVPLYAPKETAVTAPQDATVPAVVAEAEPVPLAEVTPPEIAAAPEVAPAEAVPAEVPTETLPDPVVVAETVAEPLPPLPRAKPRPPEIAAPVEPVPAEAVPDLAEPQSAKTDSEAVTASVPGESARASGQAAVAALPGSDGKAGTDGGTASGASQSHSGGGRPGAYVDYAARLNAWLEQHKEYPRRAQLRRQVGEATLYFMIDRSGRVLDFRVEKSTGHRILDEEVVNMLKRASPVPPPPESVAGATLEYRIPIGFDPPR